jgi:FAD-dependent urate hydroxylase
MVDVAIVGAGPYGFAAAAELRKKGIESRVFGEPMTFWNSMPKGMLLRSPVPACNIGDDPKTSLLAWGDEVGIEISRPVPLEHFVEYGRWFQEKAVPGLDRRIVTSVQRENGHFRVGTEDGESIEAKKVIVAAGITKFPRRPKLFRDLPDEVVTHAVDESDLSRFAGRRVVVVGGGQSALEGAALLNESGADVEVIVRSPIVRWLAFRWQHKLGPVTKCLYAPPDVGPAIVSQFVAHPNWYRKLPRRWQDQLDPRSIRPAGAGWLKPRMDGVVPMTLGRQVVDVSVNGKVERKLDDGSKREADHILLGTGYELDVAGYDFLDRGLVSEVRTVRPGYPVLSRHYESTASGLYFVGAIATWSFGPLMRFVAGSGFAARSVARGLARGRRRP